MGTRWRYVKCAIRFYLPFAFYTERHAITFASISERYWNCVIIEFLMQLPYLARDQIGSRFDSAMTLI
jgi:hypothetical protein